MEAEHRPVLAGGQLCAVGGQGEVERGRSAGRDVQQVGGLAGLVRGRDEVPRAVFLHLQAGLVQLSLIVSDIGDAKGDLVRVQGIPVRVGGAEELAGWLPGIGGQPGPVVQPQEQSGGAEHKNQKQKQLPFTGTAMVGGLSLIHI